MTKVFNPPTYDRRFAPPLDRWRYPVGKTVWRLNGTWREDIEPYWGSDAPRSYYNNVETIGEPIIGIRDADIVAVASRPGGEKTDRLNGDRYLFLGGHVYTVSDAVAAELTTAGYGSNLT